MTQTETALASLATQDPQHLAGLAEVGVVPAEQTVVTTGEPAPVQFTVEKTFLTHQVTGTDGSVPYSGLWRAKTANRFADIANGAEPRSRQETRGRVGRFLSGALRHSPSVENKSKH